jgi:hypothetical protein
LLRPARASCWMVGPETIHMNEMPIPDLGLAGGPEPDVLST